MQHNYNRFEVLIIIFLILIVSMFFHLFFLKSEIVALKVEISSETINNIDKALQNYAKARRDETVKIKYINKSDDQVELIKDMWMIRDSIKSEIENVFTIDIK